MSDTEPLPNEAPSTDAIDQEIRVLESRLGEQKSEITKRVEQKYKGTPDDVVRSEMSAVYDKTQSQAEREAIRHTVPTAPAAKDLDTAFERTADWMSKSDSERAQMTDARNDVQKIKDNAAKFGVELSETDALKLAFELEQKQSQAAPAVPAELQASMQAVQQLYPDQPAHQMIGRYAEIDRLVKADPVEGVKWIAEQSGMNPLQLAQQLAFRYGNQQAVMHNAERIVADWFENTPGAKAVEADMVKAIESGAVKRTGHFAADLQNALRYVRGQQKQRKARAARSTDAKLRDSMEEIYDRARARR